MTRYRYFTASTLDGFLADDEHSLAWLFKHDIDEKGPDNTAAFLVDVGAQVMGSSTYMWVLEHDREWLPEIPTFVFTHLRVHPPQSGGGERACLLRRRGPCGSSWGS